MNTALLENDVESDETSSNDSPSNAYQSISDWHRALHKDAVAQRSYLLAHYRVGRGPMFGPSVGAILTHGVRASTESRSENRALENVITDSAWILSLEPGWDEADAVPIQRSTWERAATLLRNLDRSVSMHYAVALPEPRVGPVSDGSIDIFWNSESRNLLINVPADAKPVTFDGQREDGNSMTGILTTFEEIGHLGAWLMNQ